ncbi:hypothetical protein [Carboxylicivirga linearis]|uniref:Uncharacterized protein n=1 Tax=Carboxylicivirga linearis TaxID=1628157 RepID=A0ABS5JUX9_9BACT|nr:hypothetical protein [Carboxylicivirga linearis]MBS2098702.1 hypothetical protein [Carboxylicivirga linearis]
MDDHTYDPFDDIRNQLKKTRRQLLPLWIKIFLWFFLITGGLAIPGLLAGLLGATYSISLYGLESYEPISPVGLLLSIIFIVKAITAFALWTEKDWAIQLALFDGYAGILVCGIMMFVYPFLNLANGFHFNLRLELIALIPFVIKMHDIQKEWNGAKVTA